MKQSVLKRNETFSYTALKHETTWNRWQKTYNNPTITFAHGSFPKIAQTAFFCNDTLLYLRWNIIGFFYNANYTIHSFSGRDISLEQIPKKSYWGFKSSERSFDFLPASLLENRNMRGRYALLRKKYEMQGLFPGKKGVNNKIYEAPS